MREPIPPIVTICVTLSLVTACYGTTTVAPEEFFALGGRLEGPRQIGEKSAQLLLESESMVRAHLKRGGATSWFKAGRLSITPDGLLVGPGLTSANVRVARVTGVGQAELELVQALAPLGGQVRQSAAGEGYQLEARQPEQLVEWAVRFASRAQDLGMTSGVWHFSRSTNPFSSLIDFDESGTAVVAGQDLIDTPVAASTAFAPGIPRAEVTLLEVNSFDPLSSAAAVPFFPLVLVALLLDPAGVEDSMNPPSSDWSLRSRSWGASRAVKPLFTGRARRRAIVQFLGGAEASASIRGDIMAAVGVGARIRNFYEFVALARQVSIHDLDPSGSRDTRTLFGLFMGAHVDSDGDPRFAFAFGIEVAGTRGKTPVTSLSLKWGPRLRLYGPVFATVSPFNLTHHTVSGVSGELSYSVTRIMSGIEIGGSL